MKIVKTICGACAQNDCGMDVFVEDYRKSGEAIPDDSVTVTSLKIAV